MQTSQQLQWKKAQAQKLLLSRKRKLAEVFSATLSDSLEDYHQKLLAFQDANNLERGCSFDESTLPPRSIVTRSQRRHERSRLLSNGLSPTPTTSRQKTPVKDELTPPAETPQILSEHSPGKGTIQAAINRQHGPSMTNGYDEAQEAIDCAAGGSRNSSRRVESKHEDAQGQEAIGNTAAVSSLRLTPPDSSVESGESISDEHPPEVEPDGVHLKIGKNIRTGTNSPVPPASTSLNVDPQSSPASSPGDQLSNTPGLAMRSPDTSPDKEETSLPPDFSTSRIQTQKGREVPKKLETTDSTREQQETDLDVMDLDSIDQLQASENKEATPHKLESQPRSPTNASIRKPSMRIETQTNIENFFKSSSESTMVESPGQMTATPRRGPLPLPLVQDPSKRATRISSGVLQKKSVSEILGETPRASSADSSTSIGRDSLQPEFQQPADRDAREKEKSKLSTVVFAKPQKILDADTAHIAGHENAHNQGPALERDYLYTLFESKAYSTRSSGPLSALIQNAHKALSTADHLIDYNLQNECRILKRLYQLQEKGRWALRQPKRANEAPRPTSHWDFLLDQMKWMRTDFREERKWKLVAARELATACAIWHTATPEERRLLQVKVRPSTIQAVTAAKHDVEMDNAIDTTVSSHPTPDLIPSHEDDSVGGDLPDPRDLPGINAPAAIFSLGASDFNFATAKTPAFDKLLNELPLYQPTQIEPDMTKSSLAEMMDAKWKTEIVPVSRYATEKLHVQDYKPSLKRGRYDYQVEPVTSQKVEPLPPRDANVALFMSENKQVRDRIHPGHSFRPPSEHPMPAQSFFETRSSSQWTHAEDDELRRLVKDYSYNWSLISSVLTPRSLYTSGADRRTPWECFERWIGLEGLPADMSKTPYFKSYSGRIEAAGKHVAAQIEEAQRRAGVNVQIPPRKRTTQPVRVDRKRGQRHLAMLDAMRKLAKKRETAIQKQQHQAEVQAMRKVNEVNQPKAPFKHPGEYAALRQERDQKRAEQQEIYRQQLLAHQRATQQAQRGQSSQINGLPNGIPASAGGMRAPPGGVPGIPNGNMPIPGGGRPHQAMMGMMNGMPMSQAAMMGPQALAKAQAQMQVNLARGINTSPHQIRVLQEAQKIQLQQQQMMQQQNGQHSSPIGPHAALANGQGMHNAAYMAAMVGVNGTASPGQNGNSSSPRSQIAGQALSSGLVPAITQIQAKLRDRHPNMSEEEVLKQASQQLQQYQRAATAAAAGQGPQRPMTHNQAAVNAAMGAMNSAAHAQNSANLMGQYPTQTMLTPEQIQQYNRMQMQRAQQAAAAARGMQAPGMQQSMMSMTNSPVMNMARPVSQQGISRSVTPRDQRSDSMGQQGGQASPRPGSSRVM